MTLQTFDTRSWDEGFAPAAVDSALEALEGGRILFFPNLSFEMSSDELMLLRPETVDGAKNVSYSPATGKIGGTDVQGAERDRLRDLLERFSRRTATFVRTLLPAYVPGLQQGRTSLRPVEVAGRVSSWRADDTRLHVDAFPSVPMRGRRILRVFSNVNPSGRPRTWKVGGSFEDVVRRFRPALRRPLWGSHATLYLVRATKAMRAPYDHYMLQLHDRMKADGEYQAAPGHVICDFPAGSTWMVFTDQVPHAALAGIHQLEQTFYVPVSSLRHEASAPLRVLEELMGRKLA